MKPMHRIAAAVAGAVMLLAAAQAAFAWRAGLGDITDPQLQATLKQLGDPDPFSLLLRFGPSGRLRHLTLALSPIDTGKQASDLRISWPGATVDMGIDGFYGRGGSADASLRWAPMRIDQASSKLRIELGAIEGRGSDQGRPLDFVSRSSWSMAPSVGREGEREVLRIDRMDGSLELAMHSPGDPGPDNPSGLPVDRFDLRSLQWNVQLTQPVAGRIELSAKAQGPFTRPALWPDLPEDQAGQAFGRYFRSLSGELQLRLPMALLRTLDSPMIQAWLDLGYIAPEGDSAVSRWVLRDGKLSANGHAVEG